MTGDPLMDFDFEDALLTHAIVDAIAIANGKVPVHDYTDIEH